MEFGKYILMKKSAKQKQMLNKKDKNTTNPRFNKLPIFGNGKLQFHEETLSWQRELSSL